MGISRGEVIRESHREKTTTSSRESMSNIIRLLSGHV